MSEPLLEVRNLKKYFPVQHGMFSSGKGFVHAVDGVSLTVEKGETFGLVGESGCGKSSLSRVILSLVKRDSGDILYKGKDVSALSRSERAKMRMVFQNPFASLNPKERVFDAIAEPYRIAGGYSRAQIQEEVLKLMDLVGLSRGYAARYPHEFSGGQRQRIGIARSLAMKPKFVVCDEAVSALDVSIQSQVINLLQDLKEKENLTYLFISHDLSVVKYISDRIGVMYLGNLVELAASQEMFEHPLHPYTEALLLAIPTTDVENRKESIPLEGDIPSPIRPPKGCKFHTRCKYCTEECKLVTPEFRELRPGHFVACHHPLDHTVIE